MKNGWFYVKVFDDRPPGESNRLGPYRRKGRRIFDAAGNPVTYADIKIARDRAKESASAATEAE